MLSFSKINKSKELLVALYFLLFILGFNIGFNIGFSYSFYNEFRVYEFLVILAFILYALLNKQFVITKLELLFLVFIVIGGFFWQQPMFMITDLLLAYLIYKVFQVINYNNLITKIIVLSSFLLFILFPLSLLEYISSGRYDALWYPLPWNIRVYDSYFLVISIFATLLDAGRSATLAYTAFVLLVIAFDKSVRLPLTFTYVMSWLAYISITYTASLGASSLRIARESSSGRMDLWINALQCWSQHPMIGCGFYQLDKYPNLSAHPHNLFIQVLTETGLIGFSFLSLIIYKITNNISWNLKKNYFVIAALLAVGIDLSLSGIHIYPITQMALLWLFVFLLKNPEFSHAQYFTNSLKINSQLQRAISFVVFMVIVIWLIYISFQAFYFSSDTPLTPPRFWVYGYRLF